MKKLKLFEEFSEEISNDYISLPSNFEENLQGLKNINKSRTEFYDVPINQIKIDLYYGLKMEIRNWLDDLKRGSFKKTKEEYHKRLKTEIDGILYKFSEGKYSNIRIEDKDEIEETLLNLIDEQIPFDEVDYFYTYDLQGKFKKLLDDFITKLVENGLFK